MVEKPVLKMHCVRVLDTFILLLINKKNKLSKLITPSDHRKSEQVHYRLSLGTLSTLNFFLFPVLKKTTLKKNESKQANGLGLIPVLSGVHFYSGNISYFFLHLTLGGFKKSQREHFLRFFVHIITLRTPEVAALSLRISFSTFKSEFVYFVSRFTKSYRSFFG